MTNNLIVLYDVDSKIPNLALMKLSTYYKLQGYKVFLSKQIKYISADKYFASVVFDTVKSREKTKQLIELYGNRIQIGGSGVDLIKKLHHEVETCFPDYTLYNHSNYALGFLTRGCNNQCPFCLVPTKEGKISLRARFDDFVPEGQLNILLLDDNLLMYPQADQLLIEIIERNYAINFSQSLDISRLDDHKCKLLTKIDSRNSKFTKRRFYFSCNKVATVTEFYQREELLKTLGDDVVSVITMFGFNTTLSEDYQILRMIKQLRLIPFLQQYWPINNIQPRVPETFFDIDLNKVIRLTFIANGQNWEKYLRWLNSLYFQTFGRYYRPLVDTIYRYNNKDAIVNFLDRPHLLTDQLYYQFT